MDLNEMEVWLHQISMDAVEDWFIEQTHNTFESYFLFFKRGGIKIAREKPEGYDLVSGQRISPSWSCAKAYQYVKDIIRKVPCLPED